MATIKVVDVLKDASYMLTDPEYTRWPMQTLLTWFNEALAAIVEKRPDALAVNAAFSCEAGPKQKLPAIGLRLIDVIRVIGGNTITNVDRSHIDANIPDWPTFPLTAELEHYIYDERDPKTFYTYPPAELDTSIEIIYSKAPDIITITDFKADQQVMALDDIYANAIQDYILYKAWMKDAEHAGNTARAMGHFNQFRVGIGDKTQADSVMAPQNG